MDTLFFYASKLIWAVMRPDTLGLLVLLTSWVLARRRPALSRSLLGVVLVVAAATALWPVQNLPLGPLESRYARPVRMPAHIDGIIVLGGAELTDRPAGKAQPQLNDAAERMTETLALARHYPDAPVIFSGGSGRLSAGPSGAEVARHLFSDLGLPPQRMVLEPAARNTAENAELTRDLIAPKPGQRWILVTSAFHMPRSVESFCAAGWTGLTPWPVDFRSLEGGTGWRFAENLFDVVVSVREWIGLAAYRLTGRAVAPTGDCLAAE